MKSGIPWNLKGVDQETRDAVIEAARRSGLSVGEWLNQALAGDGPGYDEPDDPALVDLPPEENDARGLAESIESLARRLGGMDDRARASIAGLKGRLDDIERQVSHLGDLSAPDERTRSIAAVLSAVDAINRDIDTSDERARSSVEGLRARTPSPPAEGARLREAINDLDQRIAAMARQVGEQPADPRPLPFDDIRNKLDALLAQKPMPPRGDDPVQASLLDAALRALEGRIEDAKSQLEAQLSQHDSHHAPQPEVNATAEQIGRVEARLAEIGERLAASEERQKPAKEAELAAAIREISAHQRTIDDRAETLAMRRDQKALAAAIGALRTDLGVINEQVSAINRLGAEGHGALFELARRIDTLAAEQPIDRDFLAAIRDDLATMRAMVEGGQKAPDRAKLDALGAEVAALRQRLEEDDSPRALHRLEMHISELGRGIEATLAMRTSPAADAIVDRLDTHLRDIVTRLGSSPDGDHQQALTESISERLEARLSEITTRIGGLMDSSSPAAVIETVEQRLEDHIEAISARLDGAFEKGAQRATLALHERLQAITERIDALGATQREPLATLEAIKAEIGALRAEIAGRATATDTAHLESQMHDLAAQIETVASSRGEGVALANLEAQVAQIASELEQTKPRMASLTQVEESLARLQEMLDGTAEESIATARNEARKAVEELAGTAGDGVDSETVRALMHDLDSLRAAAGTPDDETRERLESVGGTLSQVVDRLSRLERETAATPPAAPPAAQSAAVPTVARLQPHELLWKSGFRTAAETVAPATPATTPPTDEKKAIDRRADFIAAARRAAQAAQKEVASIETAAEAETEEPMQAAAGHRPGAFARISQAIRSRKRPLLLAAAAIVLAVGAMQLYGKVAPGGAALPPVTADASARFIAPEDDVAPPAAAEPSVRTATPAPTAPAAALVAPAATPDAAIAFAEPEGLDSHFGSAPSAPSPISFEAAATGTTAFPGPSADNINPVVLAATEVPSATGLDSRLGSDRLLTAASGGDPAAAFEIATRYADGTRVSKNLAKAAEWYARAAEGGVAVAQYRLGSLYERGQGVPKNLVNAVDWYQRAADQGNVNAMHNLAVLMSEGVDGPPDHDKALQWFLAAGNYGVRDSQYNLGVIYARGIGVTADLVESYKWFAIAAAQGDTDASGRRDEVAKVLQPDDLAKARAAVSAWHVKAPIAEANGVVAPPGGWDGSGQMIGAADREELVKKIQTLLADQGFDPGPADGVVGQRTVEAVRAFQRKVGVPETGRIDNTLVASLAGTTQ